MSDDTILEGMIRQSTDNPLSKEDRLPIIVIKSMKDVPYVEMELESEDDAFDAVVQIGKESATDQDYFNIGLTKALEEHTKKEND